MPTFHSECPKGAAPAPAPQSARVRQYVTVCSAQAGRVLPGHPSPGGLFFWGLRGCVGSGGRLRSQGMGRLGALSGQRRGTTTPRGIAPRTCPCAPWMACLGLCAGHQRGEPGVKGHLAGRLVGAEERSRGLSARQRASKTDLPWLFERSGVSRAASSTAPAHDEHRRGAPSTTGPPTSKPGQVPLHPAPRAAPTNRSTNNVLKARARRAASLGAGPRATPAGLATRTHCVRPAPRSASGSPARPTATPNG